MVQLYSNGHLARRGFLARLVAIVGLPLGLPPKLPGQSQTNLNFEPELKPQEGLYHRADQSDFPGDHDRHANNPWHYQSRRPILKSSEGHESMLIEAIHRNEVLYGTYDRWGDNSIRRISPIQLFHVEPDEPLEETYEPDQPYYHDVFLPGPTYLSAWDHDRHAPRTFRAEYFSPYLTAPWMRRFAGEMSQREWKQLLRRTEGQLRQKGVQPVSPPA
ncbi:MAG: hypothetical protein GVY36_17660 [Verrucomicrobia bacterium]|jgi:hypothetical protein|nr:hypothetical protein [Verrucomicrobiota bacterium]